MYSVNVQKENNITKTGIFKSTQTGTSGNPDWINTGNWTLTGLNTLVISFDAVIEMARPNGSESHEHKVSDLAISYAPLKNLNSTIIVGTTTITMEYGYVGKEPTTITLNGKNISVYFHPAKIDEHFGNQSITGFVTQSIRR